MFNDQNRLRQPPSGSAASTLGRFDAVLGLHVGEWVEVRPSDEILATLDGQGCVDGLPFMPEMLEYCGKRFQVFKTAHKTCDTIDGYKSRRLDNAVHLAGLYCDGSSHDGCQANCLIFWKEVWLKRSAKPTRANGEGLGTTEMAAIERARAALRPATRQASDSDDDPCYRCQATEMLRATRPLPWWEPRQYARDLWYGNLKLTDFARAVGIQILRAAQNLCGALPYPYLRGLAQGKPPVVLLNLQPGELVQVRSREEIMATVGSQLLNRGLSFDAEMALRCGHTYRVLRRVDRIIDEKTGKMLKMRHDCIILEGVGCTGTMSGSRLGCPKNAPHFWREIWLQRVNQKAQ